ncbi:MAG: two-component regulator propeller domain-containing protein [Maribacter sp.]|uniref:hybrid sensor histidine kinase/response regulator transcription factor n=1 Tax=Maribacter sp. TaxID=1897614 RepID=UPI003C70FE3E
MGTNRFITGKAKIVVWAICSLWLQSATSQNQISFRQLSVKNGLSQNSAISITQDSTGYLWIATQDGLNKYDGREFNIHPFKYLDVTKTKYSNLGKIYRDKEGGLWTVPLDKKLYKLNPQKNIFEIFPGLEDVSVLFQDEDLTYWVGTYSNGLYRFDPKTGSPKKVLSGKEFNGPIYNISNDPKGNVFIATNGLLIEFNKISQSFSYVRFKDYYGEDINENFSDMVTDSQERQWISTFGDGLYFRDASEKMLQRVSNLAFTDPLPANLNILDIHLDKKGRLWLATYGRGLYMLNFEKKSISHFNADKNNPRAIHYDDILCIYEDNSGTLWFGTDGGGISYFDEFLEKFNSFTNNQTPEGINIDVVRSITTDHNGAVWIGTSGKGLTQYEPEHNSWQTFTTGTESENGITSNRLMSLLVDEDGDLWIGTQDDGLILRDTIGDFREFNTTSKIILSANTVWDIFKDSKNNIWLGTRENGLIQFDKNKGEIKKFISDTQDINSLPSNNIRVITEDISGNLWIGTEENGVTRYNPTSNTFKHFYQNSDRNSYISNSIKTLYFAPNGILWIGTNGGGLNALDTSKEEFYRYTTDDGLANNVIYAILPDNVGNLWLSSNKGITKFTPNLNPTSAPGVVNYSNYDGLATEFNTGAYHIDNNGTLYFGGLDGFYWFRPEDIRENQILPKTSITGFEVLGKSSPLVSGTRLKYNQNTLSFNFSSLQYSLPEKNEYQYRLVNHDGDWVYSGNINTVRYAQLPPNDYVFQVKSSNYDGVWNEQPTSFSFTIAQPWYWTFWTKIIYGLLILVLIYGVIRYFRWRWRMQLNLRLKEDETKKLQELNTLRSKLYTDISHEFRTPLTLISGPIESKLSERGLSNSDLTNFSMIRRNTSRMLSLVDQLLDLAKVDDGKLKLKFIQGDLGLFLRNITASFEYQAESKKISYIAEVSPMDGLWYDEDLIEKITMNLLSNAMKYCPENGHCYFRAQNVGENICIVVSNTVSNKLDIPLENLFSRFYQQDEFSPGAGVGLSLVKELVQLYGGEIDVEQDGDNEIAFKVCLPFKKDFFKSKNIPVMENQKTKLDFQTSENGALVTNENNAPLKNADLPIILIVEDNADVRQFIATELGKNNQIHTAENGIRGIEKALQLVPDVIISDVRMPLCDGIELCNTLKNDQRTSHIPIILLTAHIGEENELEGLKSGADDFITKPFKLRILEKRVENLINTRRALRNRYSQEMVLQAKDIAITPADEVFLNRLQKALDDNLSNPECNAAFFCKELCMNRMQLHRKLLAFTGLSTTAFLRSQRLKQAVHILQTSDASINEVAYEVGFNTPSYFIKCFKEAYQKTPSEYLQTINK